MTKEIIEKLLLKIQPACPKDLEFSVKEIPLSGTRVLYLLIVIDDDLLSNLLIVPDEKRKQLFLIPANGIHMNDHKGVRLYRFCQISAWP